MEGREGGPGLLDLGGNVMLDPSFVVCMGILACATPLLGEHAAILQECSLQHNAHLPFA